MGDPSGVGPEIISKALSDRSVYYTCVPVVLGDPGALLAGGLDTGRFSLNEISVPKEAVGRPDRIDLMPLSRLKRAQMEPGRPTREGGTAMVEYITRAVEMAGEGALDAMVTCPINKALMHEAGFPFEGHTQLISNLTQTRDYVMMLAGERLKVSLVTIHCALRDVPGLLDGATVYRTISITDRALKEDFALEKPRIAVAALNPHAGEQGLFGNEEREIIGPAIERARSQGIGVDGPFPADTLFHRAVKGEFDAVVAMYHDQGLTPLKLLHFSDAVNITLGLPIVRTSVDHGTAYDIAGKGIADPSSLKAAIRLAAFIVENRKMSKLTG
ncbi:MAG: 4-hydroxythreonine-4-phosphate dehydrogenase PdxA [Deltaproteobacteria bacterium]|nr:4-hydroxythreonine-4-phosphate dehydrogenase PdxA [Deltaproteobacteria bacterium]MBW2137615.1 4-hydroxythreonine-4-phosphate dehydrogenase PdxA [Deltaproteobacteria bacterium]